MIIHLPEPPGGALDPQRGAIKAPAAAIYSSPLVQRLHWLLGCGPGVIFAGGWPSGSAMETRRIYHRPSANATGIVCAALVERAAVQGGSITITPDDGGGTALTDSWDVTTATGRFDAATGWDLWIRAAYLADTAFQYHTVTWSDLCVRKLVVWELPRAALDTASDNALLWRAGSYAGLEALRMITDSSTAGIPALIAQLDNARGSHKRHIQWMVADADAWSHTPVVGATWEGIADKAMATTGFGFLHRARDPRSDDASQSYDVRIYARDDNAGTTTDFRLASTGTADTVEFSALGTSFAFLSPDASASLDIDATGDDTLKPECRAAAADGTKIYCAQISFVEQ